MEVEFIIASRPNYEGLSIIMINVLMNYYYYYHYYDDDDDDDVIRWQPVSSLLGT